MKRSFTPTLSELQAFGTCAECGSVTEAARRLGLTQSAVSRSLASLEARLGVALFHRVRKRLVISDAGAPCCGTPRASWPTSTPPR